MRHRKRGRKFGREKGQRRAFLRSLVSSLIIKGRIETTEARAKEISRLTSRLVTRAKNDTLANRRFVLSKISQEATKKLFSDVAPKFKGRGGGYLRVVKTRNRLRDASPMAIVEFVE
jgi:large subunit ribosomal protein L17